MNLKDLYWRKMPAETKEDGTVMPPYWTADISNMFHRWPVSPFDELHVTIRVYPRTCTIAVQYEESDKDDYNDYYYDYMADVDYTGDGDGDGIIPLNPGFSYPHKRFAKILRGLPRSTFQEKIDEYLEVVREYIKGALS